jgi:hypothetical protein
VLSRWLPCRVQAARGTRAPLRERAGQVADKLEQLRDATEADELIITTSIQPREAHVNALYPPVSQCGYAKAQFTELAVT